MSQDERWQKRYQEIIDFIETSHWNPSNYYPKEKLMEL